MNNDFILYYFRSPSNAIYGAHLQTEVLIECTGAIATLIHTFSSPPKLDKILGWQTFVVDKFPDVHWNAHVKVNMRELDSIDNPKWGRPKEFTLTLRGTVRVCQST